MSDTDSMRNRLVQSAGLIAVIVFFILGFAFHGWAWSWLVFLLAPLSVMLFRPNGAGRDRQRNRSSD